MFDWIRETTLVKRSVSGLAVAFIGILTLSLTFISCDGSGSNGDGDGGSSKNPKFPPAVFMADKNVAGTVELYASFDDGDEIIKLSADLVSGGNVVDFKISPDGIFVAYVADQGTDQVFELYVVPVDKSDDETAVKVSVPVEGNGIKEISPDSGKYAFAWAPDSLRVGYIADPADLVVGFFELFSSTPDGQEKDLISDLPDPLTNPGRDVKDFEWEPNSTFIAYVADQDTNDKFELYVSPSDSNIGNRKVSGIPMVGSGIRENPPVPSEAYLFGWAPDSSRLAYIADQDTVDIFELFTSNPDGADNRKLSGPMGFNGDVDEFAWAPNNSKIAYLADQVNDPGVELYTTLPNVSVSFLKNSAGLVVGSNVTGFEWAPDSSRIAFTANKIVSRFALYTTSPNDNNNVLVSSNSSFNSEVISFGWAPDSSRIAYIADDFNINVLELFTTRPAAPLVNKISGNLVAGGDVLGFEWAPNSSRVAYTADQDENDVSELYTSTPDGSVNDILSSVIVPGGGVQDFKWAPDTSGVGYIADQDTDDVFELFASQPDGSDNTKLSGDLIVDGAVFAFEWVP